MGNMDKYMSYRDAAMGRSLGSALLVMLWVYGLVLVKGFWPMIAALLIPIYSWYLSIESITRYLGLVQ